MTNVLLCSAASAALHKACDLASKLTQRGHEVHCVLTPRAAQLVSPQLFEAVTGRPAAVDEFGPDRRGAMDHIELSSRAGIAVVAPASADLCAQIAHGLGGSLVTTALLALPAGIPRLLCPAMNPHMLASRPVQRNLGQLREDGWEVLEPESGHMACGDEGRGRLPEPEAILAAVEALLGR